MCGKNLIYINEKFVVSFLTIFEIPDRCISKNSNRLTEKSLTKCYFTYLIFFFGLTLNYNYCYVFTDRISVKMFGYYTECVLYIV